MTELEQLADQVRACQLCRLAQARTRAVPGEGPATSAIMLVGEGPGFYEDRQGRPFVGPSGNLLEKLLAGIGLSRRQVYITNVVKCRPPGNRDPQPDEIEACRSYLDRQIAAIQPKVIVTLGRYSMARYFGASKISAVHGQARTVDGRLVVAMFHPAAALHQPALKQSIEDDFRKLPALIEQARRRAAPAANPPPDATQLSMF